LFYTCRGFTCRSFQTTEEGDGNQDDILKLDATAEVDEFSRFLNEFEDELRTDKKKIDKDVTAASESPANVTTSATVTSAAESGTSAAAAPAKRPRLETERKVVNGKRMRKKVRERTPSMSPEGGRIERRQSPLRVSPSFNRYVIVPVPIFEKLWFRFRFRLLNVTVRVPAQYLRVDRKKQICKNIFCQKFGLFT
jgi:hypothetical protein